MTETVTARPSLGTSVLSRRWFIDVNTGTAETPVWTPVGAVQSFQPTLSPTTQDDSDFDSAGYASSTITQLAWGATFTCGRKPLASDPTSYDPGQEALRLTSLTLGTQNSAEVRFYEMGNGQLAADGGTGPRVEAYQGNCAVAYEEQSGSTTDTAKVQFTLTGQGQRQSITHPDPLSDGS